MNDVAAARRPPNPKPLLAVLMVVAFFGGSCTVQKMLGPSREMPTEEQLAPLNDLAKDAESAERVKKASRQMLEEQARLEQRYHPYAVAFGLALVTLYSFVFVLGLRAWGFAHGAAGPLSKVSILVLPARVAVAAVDLAIAKGLEPATRAAAVALAQAQRVEGTPEQMEEAARMLGDLAPLTAMAAQAGSALIVCVLFHFAWRYFQRPEVVAYLDRMAGPAPEA